MNNKQKAEEFIIKKYKINEWYREDTEETRVYMSNDVHDEYEEEYKLFLAGLEEGGKEHLEQIKEKSKTFNAMSKEEKKNYLCRQIKNAIYNDIHSNVCYMLNFCDMPQEMATELYEHYNAIKSIIKEWE